MATITPEEIPAHLQPPAQAALAWLNDERGTSYELTGLADVETAPAEAASANPFELSLVLCDGEMCAREQVSVRPEENGYAFDLVQAQPAEIPPLLDPPANVRGRWLDQQLEKFDFILLLFYRGRW